MNSAFSRPHYLTWDNGEILTDCCIKKKETLPPPPLFLCILLAPSFLLGKQPTFFCWEQLLFLGLGLSLKLSVSLITKHICSVHRYSANSLPRSILSPPGRLSSMKNIQPVVSKWFSSIRRLEFHWSLWTTLLLRTQSCQAMMSSSLFFPFPPQCPHSAEGGCFCLPTPSLLQLKNPSWFKRFRQFWVAHISWACFLSTRWMKGAHNTAASHGHTLHQNARPCPNHKSPGSINK